jgi:ribose-phosphate pyrophosphokinase
MSGRLQIFSGTANTPLAQEIAACLNIHIGRSVVDTFENGESRVRIEDNVRGCDVFVIQPTCTPVNHNLMELLIIIDALRRASVSRVTAVIPYYGYAKQEKKTSGREPIAAKLVANLIRMAGTDRVLTMDLHAPAIEGFFDIPVDHLQAMPLLADHLNSQWNTGDNNIVVVSPDAGGVGRANQFRQRLNNASLAIIARQRTGADVVKVVDMVGEVEGKTAIIVDDMISTGKTLMDAVKIVLERGAREVYACSTHGIFAAKSMDLLARSPVVETLVTNSIPQPELCKSARVQVISVAPLFAEAILRIHKDLSLSVLFS